MARNFCPVTYCLLDENTFGDKLMFESPKIGVSYEARPEDTLLINEETSEVHSVSKYRNTLSVTAYDPSNPRVKLEKGCEKCGRKVISYQRLGEEKRVYYVCLCGQQWGG